MNFLLDTNVISELRKAGDRRADPEVIAWLSGVDAERLYLSSITLLELERGVLRLERRDLAQGRLLRQWMNQQVLPEFRSRTLPLDADAALRCASLHVPDPKPERDAMIASIALLHGMTVVTRKVADFETMGVPVLNPWAPSLTAAARS